MKATDEFEKLLGDAKAISDNADAYRPLLARWLLELAMTLEWYKIGGSQRNREIPSALTDDDFCVLTGMESPDDKDKDISYPKTSAGWKRHFKTAFDKARKVKLDTKLPLYRNIALLSEMLKLCSCISFKGSVATPPLLMATASRFADWNSSPQVTFP